MPPYLTMMDPLGKEHQSKGTSDLNRSHKHGLACSRCVTPALTQGASVVSSG